MKKVMTATEIMEMIPNRMKLFQMKRLLQQKM